MDGWHGTWPPQTQAQTQKLNVITLISIHDEANVGVWWGVFFHALVCCRFYVCGNGAQATRGVTPWSTSLGEVLAQPAAARGESGTPDVATGAAGSLPH
eukprot:3395256-Amphidinium_carterae.1